VRRNVSADVSAMKHKWVYALWTVTILAGLGAYIIGSFRVPRVQGLTNADVRQIRRALSPFVHGHPFANLVNWRSWGISRAVTVTIGILPFEVRRELRMRVGNISRNTDGSVAVRVLEGKSFYGTFTLTRERSQWSLYNCEIQGVGTVNLR
jgi:hypothetical protein